MKAQKRAVIAVNIAVKNYQPESMRNALTSPLSKQ
jgi:hypothetical protein